MKRLESNNGVRQIVLSNGSKRYEARVHRVGEKTQSKRFETKKEAIEWKRSQDTSIDKGAPTLDSKTVLIEKIIKDYIKHRGATLPSNQKTDYERVMYDIGQCSIRSFTNADVKNYIDLLRDEPIKRDAQKTGNEPKKTYAPATVRKFFYAFKKAVTWHARKFSYYVDEHLFEFDEKVVPPAWGNKRKRRLAEGEESKLYSSGIERANTYSSSDWRSIIGFALETAMREQEIVFARWTDLGPDDKKLNIPEEHVKTETARVVLLSKKAREIVANQRSNCPDGESRIFYQFTSPDSVCASFARLSKRANISDLIFHDFRHEATSRLCESGKLNMMEIMEMTGHKNMTTFQGYVHLLTHENSTTLD